MDRYTTLARRAAARHRREGDLGPPDLRAALDIFPDLCFEARISGRRGRPGDREHGGAVQLREIRQSAVHESGDGGEPSDEKRLHVDTGREMHGGQWQALYLIERLKDAVLLARDGFAAAGSKRGRGIERAVVFDALRCIAGARIRPGACPRCAGAHAGSAIAGGRSAGGLAARRRFRCKRTSLHAGSIRARPSYFWRFRDSSAGAAWSGGRAGRRRFAWFMTAFRWS